jgi:predicted phosphodiesterase
MARDLETIITAFFAGLAAMFIVSMFAYSNTIVREDIDPVYPSRRPLPDVVIVHEDGTEEEPKNAESIPGIVTVVVVCDTHGNHKDLDVPSGDIFVHCGDWSHSGGASEVELFDAWLGKLPHKHKIVISGNMDGIGVYAKPAGGLFKNAKYLLDSSVWAEGLLFYGSPWTPRYDGGFQYDGESMREGKAIWDKVPVGVDVLVTHGPPYGVLDETRSGHHVGDRALLLTLHDVHPQYHVFGHVHNSYGQEHHRHTTFINAAVADGHDPVVFHLLPRA